MLSTGTQIVLIPFVSCERWVGIACDLDAPETVWGFDMSQAMNPEDAEFVLDISKDIHRDLRDRLNRPPIAGKDCRFFQPGRIWLTQEVDSDAITATLLMRCFELVIKFGFSDECSRALDEMCRSLVEPDRLSAHDRAPARQAIHQIGLRILWEMRNGETGIV